MSPPHRGRWPFVALLAAGLAVAALRPAMAAAASSLEGGRPVIRSFTPREFEAHNQVFYVTEAPSGLLYFAVYGNVLEFDGRTWRKVPVPTSWIRTLAATPDGAIYVGATDELGVCRPNAQGLLAYESLVGKLPAASRPVGPVWSSTVHDGAVWFAAGKFVARLQGGELRLHDFSTPTRSAIRSVHGHLLLRRAGEGLYVWRAGRFELLSALPELAAPLQVAMAEGEGGAVLIATEKGHLFRLRQGQLERWEPPIAKDIAAAGLRDMRRLRDGSLVFTTVGSGLLLADAEGRLRERITEAAHGLVSDVTYYLCEDSAGGLWVTTYGGISRLELGSGLTLFDSRNGRGPTVNYGMQRWRGQLYIGSNDGLYRLDAAAGGQPARLAPLLRSASAMSLQLHDDTLLATSEQGIYRLAGEPTPRLVLPISTSAAAILSSITDPARFFVGTTRGVFSFRHVEGRAVDEGYLDDRGVETQSMLEEPDGTLWLGTTQHGYLRLRRRPGAASWQGAERVYFEPGQRGLPADPGWCRVVPGLEGSPLFSTGRGAFVADAARENLLPAPPFVAAGKAGLYSHPLAVADANTIYAQVGQADALDELALGRIVRRDGTWVWQPLPKAASELAGYLGAYHLHYEAAPGRDGVLWVSGRDALVRVDLATAFASSQPAPLATIRRVSQRDVGRWGAGVGTAERPLQLAFSREPIEFAFAAPRFDAAAKLAYQTRLLGYADAWSEWSPRGDVSFTNLSGGPFVFEVRARDGDGRVGPVERFVFAVAPPWHRSTPALAAYAVLLVGAVLAFVRWRLRQAERERARLEQLVAQRTEELRQAKDAADQANRAKSVFLANMSHELRTPLNGVIGYAQVLMKDRDLTPKNRERVQIMQTSGEHLLRMINEVLDFSKIEAGKMELMTTPFHLPQLLRDIAAAISPRAEQKQLELAFDPAPNLPDVVLGDPLKLRQVIDNLLINAVKFTAQGTVRFTAEPLADEGVKFTVADTGVGMTPEDLAHLFRPFHQAADGRPPEPGTGLGLAIGKRMVELMGGTLAVESERGHGSTFSFAVRLPVLAADATDERKTFGAITGYGGRRRHVLVVDDVAINRQVLHDMLAPLGFEVTSASDAAEALRLAAETPPDLVLLDLRMPGVSGIALARRLRALPRGAEMKLIAMSASVLSFNRDDAFAAGCDDFLPKPFREDDLLARMGMALQLEWRGENGAPSDSRSPFAEVTTRLPPSVLAELLAHAHRGEIAPLRKRLADLRGDPLADTLDSLAKRYRMERIRELLEIHATPTRPS